MKLFTTSASLDRELQPSPEMKDSVTAMEKIVDHNFKNKRLLEEALTHSSITCFPSYKRLAVLGDAALGLAMSNHLFLAYPNMDRGNFTDLRSANVSTVKFACAAVKHGFYGYLRHNSPALDDEVRQFARAVSIWNEKNETTLVYDESIQPSHVLADIVESVAAAIYIDLNFDLDKLWMKFKHLLEPIITLEGLSDHPVSVLYKLCQKHGKLVKIKEDINDTKNLSIASVYVDGILIASASYKHMAIARLHAARKALPELFKTFGIISELVEVAAENEAKQNLNVLCDKKRIPRPTYNKVKESGPEHEKRFVSSVEIATLDGKLKMMGDERSRIKDAENSAAALMILGLLQSDAMTNTKEAANNFATQGEIFKDKRLLEQALTHSSITYSPSYKRLKGLGQAALEIAVCRHLFLAYPNIDQGNLSKLRSANVNMVKFACAAVEHGFYPPSPQFTCSR